MNALDQATQAQVTEAYGLGRIVQHWPATHGIENSNFFLTTSRGDIEREYVLTIMEQSANAGERLVPLLDACERAGLPVPAPLRDRHGSAHIALAGKQAMLCPRLPGRHVHNPTLPQVAALGRFTARLHRATAALDPPLPAYPRDSAWLTERTRHCAPYLSYSDRRLLEDSLAGLARLLRRRDVAALPQGPIHADLFRDNVLFDPRGLTGVLDFHHAAHGFLIYDLAVAVNDWCTDGRGELDMERTLVLLRAYHRIRPLTAPELWFFPQFALYGALAFWLSRLSVSIERLRGRAVRGNDPAAFGRIVANHWARPLCLDPRLLE